MSSATLQPVVLLILFLTGLASLINSWFYLGPARRLVKHLQYPPSTNKQHESVSILIAARNEEKNLKQFLPKVLLQEGADFDVVVVEDNSTDNSLLILQKISDQYAHLRVVPAYAKTKPGKKAALAQAIEEISAPWILATDADCQPASSQWARQMLEVADDSTEIVLGYSPYQKQSGWLNRWIRFETLYTAAQYLSATLVGRAYMGVGRNMLYRRDLYHRLKGFESHAHLAGGDDDLLVNQGTSASNTRICIARDAWVYSTPHRTWGDYLRQKTRHLSVGTSYKTSDQVWLGILAASHVAHYIGVLLLFSIGLWPYALLIYGVRLMATWWRMHQLARGLGESDLTPFLPLLDMGIGLYYLRFSIAALFPTKGKKNW